MSLVVHKLVLSPGGAATNTQNPTHHVTLAAYTHTPRSNVGETMGRSLEGSSSVSVNAPSSLYSSSSSSSSSSKHSSTYNLPFVLQDHNYGAPPPPTPPQSPPPLPATSATPTLYHLSSHQTSHHHQSHSHNHNTIHHHNSHQHPNHQHHSQSHTQHHINIQHHHQHLHHSHHQQPQQQQQHHHQQPQQQQHHHHHQQKSHLSQHQSISNVVPTSRLGIITSSSSPVTVSGLSMSHPLTVMPPHRQHFMPHPKAGMFPSHHIPPMPVELHQSITAPTSLSSSMGAETDDDSRLSDRSSSVGPSGEETETAPEGEGDEQPMDDSITRCICDFSHDDGYMIQCDRCFVWQHVDCMEIDRNNIPDEYLCEACEPRRVDRFKARALQIRRRQEIKAHLARLSSSDSDDNIPISSKSRGSVGKPVERKVVKKKKAKQVKEVKNNRKGSMCQLKKSSVMSSCNNNILPENEEKERRMLVKTRRRKSSSMSGGEIGSDDSNGGPVERLRAWVEDYEIAVTNHYSPELRARVHAARINGVSPDLRASTQGALLGHRCKVVPNPRSLLDVFDSKILVAATRLTANTAIAEYQGKYLLASQWNAQQPITNQVYLPYVLQYHMPKEGLSVCVDARTYGNDARFTRRSCRPNAEVRHVVERGSLHLYLVATRDIEEGEEVTLSLDTANSTVELVCCFPDDHDCFASKPTKTEQVSPSCPDKPVHRKNGVFLSNKKSLKKHIPQPQLRMSKRTTSTESRGSDIVVPPVQNPTPITPVKQRRTSGCGKSPVKSPVSSAASSPDDSSKESNSSATTTPIVLGTMSPETPKTIDKQQQQKMTREERKIAAYMKAFERMEKAAQRRQEIEKKKEEDKGKDVKDKDKKRSMDGEDDDWEKTSSADESVRNTPNTERCRRKGKKGRGKGSPQKRNSRIESTTSDLTGDESSCASVGLMSPAGGSIEGIALNFNSPPQGNSNMGFRFPKTKKALMNEWLNETVDPVMPICSVSGVGDVPSGVPTCYMRSPATPLRRSSSVNQGSIQGTVLNMDMPGGSAKKRWLRQAISEETESPQYNGLCPSPNSRPDSPTSGGDYITPLKKRRLARESMSSEHSSTPPTTPVHSASTDDDKLMMEEMEAELAEVASKDKVDGNGSEENASLSASAKPSCELDGTKDIDVADAKREKTDDDDEERMVNSGASSLASKINKDAGKGKKVKKLPKSCMRGRGRIEQSDDSDSDEEENLSDIVAARSVRSEVDEEVKLPEVASKKPSDRARKQQRCKKGKSHSVSVRRSERQQISAIKKETNMNVDDDKTDVCNEKEKLEEEKEKETETKTVIVKVEEEEEKVKCDQEKMKVELSTKQEQVSEPECVENDSGMLGLSAVKEEEKREPIELCKEDKKEEDGVKIKVEEKEEDAGKADVEDTKNKEQEKSGNTVEEPVEVKEECDTETKIEEPMERSDKGEGCSSSKDIKQEVSSNREQTETRSDKGEGCSSSKDIEQEVSSNHEQTDTKASELISAETTIADDVDSKAILDERDVEGEKHDIPNENLNQNTSETNMKMEPDTSKSKETGNELLHQNQIDNPLECESKEKEESKESTCNDVSDSEKTDTMTSALPEKDVRCEVEKPVNAVDQKGAFNEQDINKDLEGELHSKEEVLVDEPLNTSTVQKEEDATFCKFPEDSSPQKDTSRDRSRYQSPIPFEVLSGEDAEKSPPRTPEIKGPRTPEGPAPSSPDEMAFTPPSPRSPASMRSPSDRERAESPDRILKSKGPCTPPSLPPASPPSLQDENGEEVAGGSMEESLGDNENSMASSSSATSCQPKPAPVKRKLSILEYRKRKSVNSEIDGTGSTSSSNQNTALGPSTSANSSDSTVNPTLGFIEAPCSPSSLSKDLSDAETPPSPASPPDLPLSPIQPLSLMLIPDVLDKSLTKEEIRKEDSASKLDDDSSNSTMNASGFSSVKNGNITTSSKINSSFTKINSVINENLIAGRSSVAKPNTKNELLVKNSRLGARPNNLPTIGNVPAKGSSISTKNSKNSGPSVATEITGATVQDVKWNAAPTLLERQRENLTERLRREFGLCVSDDDEEKLDDDHDRIHKRAKDKNLPPPPPPSTAPPKNSIFHGREVTVQKVPCSTKMGAISSNQLSSASSALHNIQTSNCLRVPSVLPNLVSSYSGGVVPPHLPVPPPPAAGSTNPGVGGVSSTLLAAPPPLPPPRPLYLPQSLATSSGELGGGLTSVPPPPRGIVPVSRTVPIRPPPCGAVQSVGETSLRPRLPSTSGSVGRCLPTGVPPPNSYSAGSYPRSAFPSPGVALPQSLSVYAPVRAAPPAPGTDGAPPRPGAGVAPVRQPPPPHPPAHGPPGIVAPSLVYSSSGYPGLDCSAPGSRGS